MLLLLLSCFSRVRLCATPETAAHQAPPSLGFSRQEHWSGLPFPSPMHESDSEVAQSCQTPSDPMDCSLPGSSVHEIFQATVLERRATAFSLKVYTALQPKTNLSKSREKSVYHRRLPMDRISHTVTFRHSVSKKDTEQFYIK